MTTYNTIDLDTNNKEMVNKVFSKIRNMSCCEDLICRPSYKKGYHYFIRCKKVCEMCRLVFDDQRRLAMDSARAPTHRNILFTGSGEWSVQPY